MFETASLIRIADETSFSGVASVTVDGERVAELAKGSADRRTGRAVSARTLFAVASATKGFTALTVASMVESGEMSFDTTLRHLVGDQLPLVRPEVTIEHLLGHTSGVGDYLDEEQLGDINEHILGVSAHTLETPDDYVPLIDKHPQVFTPGDRFAYNNSGYVMLSIAIERASNRPFHTVVRERVFEPAGMAEAGFYRSDDLPENAAIGYLEDGRSNVFHLPVIGGGDGGAYVSVADIDALWSSLLAGRIVSDEMVAEMTSPRSTEKGSALRYGLGFWLRPVGDDIVVMLEGMDAGVSFRSACLPDQRFSYTVISNTSSGVWPLVRFLDDELARLA